MRLVFAIVLGLFGSNAATAQEVGPGATAPNPALVPGMFRTICLNNLPDFANAEALMLASGQFAKNERANIVYHQDLNFSGSIRMVEGRMQCSVVFFSEQPVAQIQPMLEAARDAFQAEVSRTYPNASIDTISADGDSEGFHRMAIFIDITQ